MAELNIKLGQTVQTQDGRQGIVRYMGELHIAAGNWLGLELPDSTGKNDGSVKGERYFTCQAGHGIFVRRESIVKITKQPTAVGAVKTNGAAAKPRPSSGITADVARKRQSLMSGSGSTVGSRLSTRSPTKSPTKPITSSASSNNSTPRTGTPTTTARTSDSSAKSRLSVGMKPAPRPAATTRTSSHTARPSLTGTSRTSTSTSVGQRRPLATSRLSISETVPKAEIKSQRNEVTQDEGQSPTIEEEEDHALVAINEKLPAKDNVDGQFERSPAHEESPSRPSPATRPSRTASLSRTAGANNVDSRTAQQRELEQLKAKIRTLEKQREEDQDRLKSIEKLQSDKDRFESIIQALQKKLKTNQQEMAGLRSRVEEAEAKANAVPERSPEHESEMELATLDKEMAEERAETYQIELEALKSKHEELELEVEILREENRELGSVMSPEEKASAGWMQMEREQERLREALIMLRDYSQQIESDLKTEVRELQDNLDEVEKTAGLYTDTAERLERSEETNQLLKEQLEAVETNDEVVEAMEAQREENLHMMEQLKKQIQEFEEHIQVTDELEIFHIDEEKRLHKQLDDTEALLNESHRYALDQDKVIEDLEYTLTKFRDVVQGLQTDIDELRRSKDISELQASEMSSKSKAMMDLNLRLQNNAAKTQSKTIDIEMDKIRAELASKHVDILALFVPESFETERNPVLGLLCVGRIRSKAALIERILRERLRERAHLSPGDEVFRIFDVVERMDWIAGVCDRFERFMASCEAEQFGACSNVVFELEPVERSVTGWIEALKRDELGSDGPEHLKRMQSILVDLSEKLVLESNEAKATELVNYSRMVENYSGSLTGQLGALLKIVQTRLGSANDKDDESLVFDKRMDQLSTKARTIRYLSGKATRQLVELRANSMCLGETNWDLFEAAQSQAEALSHEVREVGYIVADEVAQIERDDMLTYSSLMDRMTTALQQSNFNTLRNGHDQDADFFAQLATRLNLLQSLVDDLVTKSADVSATIEFEVRSPPWTVRAKDLKAQKVIPPEVQEELIRLERRNVELGSRINEREKTIEEMGMRVELAEKRVKDNKARESKDKELKDDLDQLRAEKEETVRSLNDLRTELEATLVRMDRDQVELDTLRKATGGEKLDVVAVTGKVDESVTKQLQAEIDILQSEISSMQATVRFFREENHHLRVPVSEVSINAAKYSWLDPSFSTRRPLTNMSTYASGKPDVNITLKDNLDREGRDIYSDLIAISQTLKPVRLLSSSRKQPADTTSTLPSKSTLRSNPMTTKYTTLHQREELERWESWRTDFVKRARLLPSLSHSATTTTTTKRNRNDNYNINDKPGNRPKSDGVRPTSTTTAIPSTDRPKKNTAENQQGEVTIVES